MSRKSNPAKNTLSLLESLCLIHVVNVCELTINVLVLDIIKEQNKELRGTQRAIGRDRAALERQEKQLVSVSYNCSLFTKANL